jgi:hypothetical protein
VFSANYFYAQTNTHFTQLPQLDRLDDDATDQSIRDMTANQTVYNPTQALNLTTNPLFNPQVYAIRSLLALTSFSYLEAQDNIQELVVDWRQRLQTKRGYPGQQHIVDWMTLDTSASYFPQGSQNNMGNSFAFLTYDWVWNIGDRTALVSDGWYDPINDAARWYTFGAYFNRPDNTSYYIGYRQTDPLNSKLVTANATYKFSPKYMMSFNTSYDFGLGSGISNGVTFTRMGADAQMNIGVSYNSLLNNFSFTFMIIPNVALGAANGTQALGSSMLGGFGH